MKWVALGVLAAACGASVLWNECWIQAPQAPARITLTEQSIQKDIQFQENIKAAKKVLSQMRCDSIISELAAQAAIENHIPVRIVAADILVESGCRANAKSKGGSSIGLMQVNRRVWHHKDLFNPVVNVQVGTRILAADIHKHGYRRGLQFYFGITAGSDASNQYASKVLEAAYQRN